MKSIYGCIKNGIISFKADNYLDDDDITIIVDENHIKKEYLKRIKKLYITKKEDFVDEIDDFHSIYLYDKKNKKLVLVRDRVGLKQIYYYVNNNDIYFGRDIMALVDNYSIKKDINIEALSMYFRYEFINPPSTIFNDVYKLEHGHYLVWENNEIKINKYWDEIEKYNVLSKETKGFDESKNDLNNLLGEFVKKYIDKDNYAVYLSGGIDSSLIAALFQKYSSKKINTFSIGIYEKNYDELEKARNIATYLKTNHKEFSIDKNKAIEVIKKIPQYYTEPFADTSEVPSIVVNELAKENGIELAFTGDGADQLYCGANLYDNLKKYRIIRSILNPLDLELNNKLIKKNFRLSEIYCNKKYKSQYDIVNYDLKIEGLFEDNGQKRYENVDKIETNNIQEKRMLLDLDHTLFDKEIKKMESAAYLNNIDVKGPFLSTKIIEDSFTIPHKYKYYKKQKKYILKEILYDYIPKELIEQRKIGFNIPIKKWLELILKDELERVSTEQFINKQGIFDYEAVCRLISKTDDRKSVQLIWNYLMFQIWYETYMLEK